MGARERVPASLRKYLGELKKAPRYPPFHGVMHLLLLKLDWAKERVDRACGGAEAGTLPAEAAASGVRERERAE